MEMQANLIMTAASELFSALPLVSNVGVSHFRIVGVVMPSPRSLTSCCVNV